MGNNKIIFKTLFLATLFFSTSSMVLGLTGEGISTEDLVGSPLKSWLSGKNISSDFESLVDAAQNHPDSNVRWRAVQVLGIYFGQKSEKIFRLVVENDAKAIVRETAALALVKLGSKGYLSVIKEGMEKEPFLSFKIFRAHQLVEYGDTSGYAYVIKGLTHSEEFMRLEALSALPLFFNFNVSDLTPRIDPLEKFVELKDDPSPYVRASFVSAIGRSGKFKERFKELVMRMKKDDPDEAVRRRANSVLIYWRSEK